MYQPKSVRLCSILLASQTEMSHAEIEVRRLAVRYDPCTLVVEYRSPPDSEQLRLFSVKLKQHHVSCQENDTEIYAKKVAARLAKSYPRYLGPDAVDQDQVDCCILKRRFFNIMFLVITAIGYCISAPQFICADVKRICSAQE